jgi:hypothetical protein
MVDASHARPRRSALVATYTLASHHNYQGWLNVMMLKGGLTYHIARPICPIHLGKDGQKWNYATLAGEKLADCLIWISYLVKARSKLDSMTHIYFGSRPSRTVHG